MNWRLKEFLEALRFFFTVLMYLVIAAAPLCIGLITKDERWLLSYFVIIPLFLTIALFR